DFLAQSAGIEGKYSKQEYRIKDEKSSASDYSFGAYNSHKEFYQLKMRTVGDLWGTGLFKANACDFCDDVTTELADISLGDAWLKPYDQDGSGHNVVVSRSVIADRILQEGLKNGELKVERLPLEQFLLSQQGSFNHRHDGMSTRISLAKRAGAAVPPSRVGNIKLPIYLRLVQQERRQTRLKSLDTWAECK